MDEPNADEASTDVEQPRGELRLFFSVDLVGSTAFKALRMHESTAPDALRWSRTFEDFYRNFPVMLLAEADRFEAKHKLSIIARNERPAPWKFLGDEILLSMRVEDSRTIPFYLVCFRNALRQYSKKLKPNRMACKGTLWTAGFPISNRHVEPSEGRASDYIGPHMDCGFRLAKFATERRLAVSLDVAWIAAEHIELERDEPYVDLWNECAVSFHFHGMEVMKGVIAERPYPVFWVDTVPAKEVQHEHPDDILVGRKPCSTDDVARFCSSFTKANDSFLFKPYVMGDRCERFDGSPPPFLMEQWRKLQTAEKAEDIASLPSSFGDSFAQLDASVRAAAEKLARLLSPPSH